MCYRCLCFSLLYSVSVWYFFEWFTIFIYTDIRQRFIIDDTGPILKNKAIMQYDLRAIDILASWKGYLMEKCCISSWAAKSIGRQQGLWGTRFYSCHCGNVWINSHGENNCLISSLIRNLRNLYCSTLDTPPDIDGIHCKSTWKHFIYISFLLIIVMSSYIYSRFDWNNVCIPMSHVG